MADTKSYLDYITQKKRRREKIENVDFSKMPEGVDVMAVAEELASGLAPEYADEIRSRAKRKEAIKGLDYGKVKFAEPKISPTPPMQPAPMPLNIVPQRPDVPPVGVAPTLPSPTKEQLPRPLTESIPQRAKSFARGTVGVASGAAEGFGDIAGALGAVGVEEAAKKKDDFLNEFSKRHLSNPENDLLDDIMQGLGSTLPFMGLGRAVAGGTRLAGTLAKTQKGLDLAKKLGSVFGISSLAVANALTEGGHAAQELRYEGVGKEKQQDAFWKTFIANIPLTLALDRWMIGGAAGNRLKAAMRGGQNEFVEETLQNFITKLSQDKPIDLGEALYEGGIGAIVGGGMGAAFPGARPSAPEAAPEPLPTLPLSPNLDEAGKSRALQMAQTDPVAAMKSVTPSQAWPEIDEMARSFAEAAEADQSIPAEQKRTAVQSALTEMLNMSLAPATGAAVEGVEQGMPAPAVPQDPQRAFMTTQIDVIRKVAEKAGLKGGQVAEMVSDRVRGGEVRGLVEKGMAEGKNVDQMADEFLAQFEGAQVAGEATPATTPTPQAETATEGQPEAAGEAITGRWSDILPEREAQGGQAVAAIDMTDDGAGAVILKTGDGRFTVRSEVVDVVSPHDEDGLYFNSLAEAKEAVELALPEPGKSPVEMTPERAIPVIQAMPGAEAKSIPEARVAYEAAKEQARAEGEPVFEDEPLPADEEFTPPPVPDNPGLMPYEQASEKFPGLTQDQHKALVRGAVAANLAVPEGVIGQYPDMAEEMRAEAQEGLAAGERPQGNPILKLIRSKGFINRENYEKHWKGELPADDMRYYIRKDGKATISEIAEAAAEEGLIPEYSENTLFEAIGAELRERAAVARDEGQGFLREPTAKISGTKVVDEEGRPLRVYHGTGAAFKEFSAEMIGESTGIGDLGDGFYFTDRPEVAETFAEGEAPNIRAVYLDIKNPATNEVMQSREVVDVLDDGMGFTSVKDKLAELGYDGIEFTHKSGTKEYVVFSPDQIVNAIGIKDPTALMEPGHKYSQDELFPTELEAFTEPPEQALQEAAEQIKKAVPLPVGQFHYLGLERVIKKIERDWKKTGVSKFIGKAVKTINDVAEIAAVYRHPKVETLQLIFLKNGKFVGNSVFGSGHFGAVRITYSAVKEVLSDKMKALEADSFYISHNHPSGIPTPSDVDIETTVKLGKDYGESFKGQVVTNHETFSEIKPRGDSYYQAFRKKKPRFRVPHSESGVVTNPYKAAELTTKILNGEMVGALFLDNRGAVLSFDHIEPSKEAIFSYVDKTAPKYGANQVVLVTGEEGIKSLPKTGSVGGVIQDLVLVDNAGKYFSARENTLSGWKHVSRMDFISAERAGDETFPFVAETPGFYNPRVYQKVIAKLTPGALLTARGRIQAPGAEGGAIPRAAVVKLISVDPKTGQAIVDFKGQPVFTRLDMFRETYQKPEQIGPIPGIPVKRAVEQATGLNPAQQQIVTTEAKALRAKLATEEKAARTAAKFTKAQILARIRDDNSDGKAIQKSAVEYVKMTVPKAFQGRFINLLNKATTKSGLGQVVVLADKESDIAYRKGLTEDIKKVSSRALESMKVEVNYREAVRDLLAEFDLQKRRPETILKLKALQDYVKDMESRGQEVFLPDEMYKRLEILALRPIEKISNGELENALRDLYILEAVGKEAQGQKELAQAIERGEILRELTAAATPIENLTSETQKMGKVWNKAQESYWALSPMMVFHDRMDGGKGTYDGPHAKIGEKMNGSFLKFLKLRRRYILPVQELIKKHELSDDNLNRIGIYAFKVQKNGVARVLASMPEVTEEYVKALTLTSQEMEVYQKMREGMEAIYPEVKRIMGKLYNKSVGKIDHYFSMQLDWDKLMDAEVKDRMAFTDEEFAGWRKNISAGMTKTRQMLAKSPIKINAMQVFLQHINDASYLVSMQEDVKKYSEIVNTTEYAEAAGPIGYKIMKGWLDIIARQGKAGGASKIWIIDELTTNMGAATLGFKLSTFLIQSTALMDISALVGGSEVMNGVGQIVSDAKIREWSLETFPKLRERLGGDIAYREFSSVKWLAKWQELGYAPLKMLDGLVASSAVVAAYNKKAAELGAPAAGEGPLNAEAVKFANFALDRTQASPFFLDAGVAFSSPDFLTGNVSINKAILKFKQFPVNRWFYMSYDLPRLKTGSEKLNAGLWMASAAATEMGVRSASTTIITSAIGLVGWGIASGVKRADWDDDWWLDYALTVMEMCPFVAEPMSIVRYGSTPAPAFDNIAKLAINSSQFLNAQNKYRKYVGLRKALQALATMIGFSGTAQLGQVIGWAYNPKTLTFPYNEEYRELVDIGGSRTKGEQQRLNELHKSKAQFAVQARIYRSAMERGDTDMAANAARKAAEALEGL